MASNSQKRRENEIITARAKILTDYRQHEIGKSLVSTIDTLRALVQTGLTLKEAKEFIRPRGGERGFC